jgi:aldose 1-epimerase
MRRHILLPALLALLVWPAAGSKGETMTNSSSTSSGAGAQKAGLAKAEFGRMPDGTPVDVYTLTSGNGMTVKVMTYGAIITSIEVPDKSGKTGDVTLGFDNLKQYLGTHPYFGATVGRVGNRIAKGKFTIGGVEYKLAVNNFGNHLHGGLKGFDKVLWKAEPVPGAVPSVKFSYLSKDGEEGYPGNLWATVTFSLTPKNELKIEYTATADKATPVNLTNHSYFNLAGAGNGDILGHVMMLNADRYTPVDDTLIPTGELAPVKGTPMDFTKPAVIGSRIAQVKGGYDHNYVLNSGGSKVPALAARVREEKSGRVMEVLTTEPGVQFYTGNFLDGTVSGIGGVYRIHYGFCLETQHFPDSVHHPNFPSAILKPGDTYHTVTVYRFLTE